MIRRQCAFGLVDLSGPLDSPLGLVKGRVNGDTGEVALPQKPVQLGCSRYRLDEDTDLKSGSKLVSVRSSRCTGSGTAQANLVEFEVVQQVVKLSVLSALGELDEVLLQTVQSQLGLVIDVDLKGLNMRKEVGAKSTAPDQQRDVWTHVLHELLARYSNFLSEGGAEHHDLLVSGRRPEDLLHISSHVCREKVAYAIVSVGLDWTGSAGQDAPSCSNILSHSSKTNILTLEPSRLLSRVKPFIRPGVPTTMWGHLVLSAKISWSALTGVPP